jgi:hypothetical protein
MQTKCNNYMQELLEVIRVNNEFLTNLTIEKITQPCYVTKTHHDEVCSDFECWLWDL